MSGFDDAYRAMREEAAAARNKRVLLVEGRGDVDFLTYMLDKQPLRSAGFYSRFAIGAAGGKDNVLRMLEREPEWLGLVDRDAWSARTRDAYEGKLRNLYFLPRYCIENYLIDVNILEEIFGSRGCGQELSQALRTIRAQIPGAVRHGSLWRAVQPLYDELMGLGFNGALLRFDVPSDSEIFEVLKSWDRLLDARRIYADYRAFEEKGSAMPVDEALRVWIHGKVFWRKSVAPALQEALGGMGEERLQRIIYRAMPLPTDVELLLKGLLALEKSP